MINRKRAEHIKAIDVRIEALLEDLSNYDIYSDEYESMADRLEQLVKVRNELKPVRSGDKVKVIDLTTIVNGAVSVLSLMMILEYEKTEVVTTKALSVATKWLGK